ncbi:hypothetical protein Tco_0016071 [Tanacetum coccineum]
MYMGIMPTKIELTLEQSQQGVSNDVLVIILCFPELLPLAPGVIVEPDKVNHTVVTEMMKLVVKIECFGISFDDFDKETRLSVGLQLKQADQNYVHALNELHLMISCVPSKHELSNIVVCKSRTILTSVTNLLHLGGRVFKNLEFT